MPAPTSGLTVLGLVASPLLDTAAGLTGLPLIYVTDATLGFLREVYGRDVPADRSDREAHVLARSAMVYSSRVMAERAAAGFLDKNCPRDLARLAEIGQRRDRRSDAAKPRSGALARRLRVNGFIPPGFILSRPGQE